MARLTATELNAQRTANKRYAHIMGMYQEFLEQSAELLEETDELCEEFNSL